MDDERDEIEHEHDHCRHCGRGEDFRMRAVTSDEVFLRRLLAKTREGKIPWTTKRRNGGPDAPAVQIVEFTRGEMTVTLDRFVGAGDGEEYTSYTIWWELFQEDPLLPGDGLVFRHPKAEATFEELWREVAAGVDWDSIPIQACPDPIIIPAPE